MKIVRKQDNELKLEVWSPSTAWRSTTSTTAATAVELACRVRAELEKQGVVGGQSWAAEARCGGGWRGKWTAGGFVVGLGEQTGRCTVGKSKRLCQPQGPNRAEVPGLVRKSQHVSSLINKPRGQMTNWWHCHCHGVVSPLYAVQMRERCTLSSVWCVQEVPGPGFPKFILIHPCPPTLSWSTLTSL